MVHTVCTNNRLLVHTVCTNNRLLVRIYVQIAASFYYSDFVVNTKKLVISTLLIFTDHLFIPQGLKVPIIQCKAAADEEAEILPDHDCPGERPQVQPKKCNVLACSARYPFEMNIMCLYEVQYVFYYQDVVFFA